MTSWTPTKIPYNAPSDFLFIQARPSEHEAIIRRQGQLARILQLLKCPCLTNGQPNMFCTVCGGRGYLFKYQTEIVVIDELSEYDGYGNLYPFGTPVTRALAVKKFLHSIQGGNVLYTVTGITGGTKVSFNGAALPKKYETVKLTYEYTLERSVTNENCLHPRKGYVLNTIGTKLQLPNSNNPFNVHGDLISVSRVYNRTTATTYSVASFNKQTITLSSEGGTKPQIEITDIMEVDYKWLYPPRIGTQRINMNNSLKKWGEELKEGDMESMIPGGYYFSKGDVITFLTPRLRETMVIQRGTGQTDELPQFDVNEIIGDIIDESGVKYSNAKFYLSEYNDLVWVTGQGPAQGKRYSVTYLYNPSYRIYRNEVNTMTNEDRRFPQNVLLRVMNKFSKKDFIRY